MLFLFGFTHNSIIAYVSKIQGMNSIPRALPEEYCLSITKLKYGHISKKPTVSTTMGFLHFSN
jgi:hypothetical protein